MLRVFSGSCMSLDDMDYIRPRVHQEPHLLGPGTEYFNDEGQPIRPQPAAHTMTKVFSGSALDLNDMNPDDDDDDMPPSPGGAMTPPTMLGSAAAGTERDRQRLQKSRTNVLVIGAGGYVGAHVVAQLLDAGYTVHCTVKDMLDHHLVQDLQTLVPEAMHRLFIAEADITNKDSLRESVRQCSYIVHCGVPAASAANAGIVDIHDQAIKALFDAIRAYGRSSVKRVILTGSATTVYDPLDALPAGGAFDESQWNTKATAKSDPVRYAKISFEKEAWRLREMVGVELTVILPSIVIGPSKTNEVSEAMRTIHDLASGTRLFPFAPNMYWNFVDVRDVAGAHVKALETPEAAGNRYIVSNQCLSLTDIGRVIRKDFPHLHPPIYNAPFLLTLIVAPLSNARISMKFLWQHLGKKCKLSTSKAQKDLSFEPRPIEETLHDAVDELMIAGQLPTKEEPRPLISSAGIAVVAAVGSVSVAGLLVLRFLRNSRQ